MQNKTMKMTKDNKKKTEDLPFAEEFLLSHFHCFQLPPTPAIIYHYKCNIRPEMEYCCHI